MDDDKHSGYARAPEVQDLIDLCQSFNEQGVEYILIGGFAVIIHGYVRGTKDIDFLVNPSLENIQKIKKALAKLPDNAAALMQDDEVEKYTVVRIADEIVIDLMAKACGISYNEAKNDTEIFEIDNIEICIATKQLLIDLKQTVRPSDQTDVQYLQMAIAHENKTKK